MQYTVLVRQRSQGNYEAVAPAAPTCKGRGRSRDEALYQLKRAIEAWLAEIEVTTIDVSPPDSSQMKNPWLETAGMFADDPTLEPMLAEIYAARAAEQQPE